MRQGFAPLGRGGFRGEGVERGSESEKRGLGGGCGGDAALEMIAAIVGVG